MRNLLIFPVSVIWILLTGSLSPAIKAEPLNTERTWTDSTGRTVDAKLVGFQDKETLILQLQDGRQVPFPLARLSQPDQALAKSAFEKQKNSPENSNQNIDWESPKNSEAYVIRGLRRENPPGYVSTKSGWEYQIKCIEAKLQFKGNKKIADGNVTAYFYNRDDKLLEKISRPPRRQGDDRKYIDPPKSFEKNKTVEVYYPLTTFLEDSDWATVLVAFGSGREYSVETMPKRSLEALDFAEKEFVFPDWVPDANRSMEDENSNVEPEIRRLKVEDKYPYSLSFNGDYRRDMPCVMGEVRVTGDITPGEGVVRLHGFDANGIKKATRQRPSSFQIEGSSSYVGRPQIADDNWHPVAFALDDYFSDRYPTYVMVFQFQGKTTAEAVSSTGATITDLDFPEKKDLKSAE